MSLKFATLLLFLPSVLSVCYVARTYKGRDEYYCDTLKDLEKKGLVRMTWVSVWGDHNVSSIDASTFRRVPNVEEIRLRYCVGEIQQNAFASLKKLKSLSVFFGDINTLKEGTFVDLPVHWLSLHSNNIVAIQPGTFRLLTLTRLDLSANSLVRISKGIFNDLSIETLVLHGNQIRELKREAFYNITNLKKLYLNDNLLTAFQAPFLINLGDSLTHLWLYNNSLEEITRRSFRGLQNLQILNLMDNRISTIQPFSFETVPNLEYLILSNNSLTELSDDVFPEQGLLYMIRIYFDRNRLSYLTTRAMEKWPNLDGIRLGGNPWQCACFDIISTWMKDHKIKPVCDADYYNGSKPLCVVEEMHPQTCVYQTNTRSYRLYQDMVKDIPEKRCF